MSNRRKEDGKMTEQQLRESKAIRNARRGKLPRVEQVHSYTAFKSANGVSVPYLGFLHDGR